MSNWAELDENNIVLRVIVGDDNDPSGDEGYQWIVENLGGVWVKTSFNGTIRKNFGRVGFTYDPIRDAFIPPKPFESWILNEDTCQWTSPTPMPTDGMYVWDEPTLSWKEITA